MPLFSPAFLGGTGEGTGIGFREKERGGNGDRVRRKELGGNGEGTGFFFLLAPELEPPTTSERPLNQGL